jgi:transportin-3
VADLEISSITLNFWYRMVADLEGIDPFDWRQELVEIYTPQLLRLMDVCVRNLMRYPSDIDDMAEDRVEDFNRHRFYVAETVEDCCRLLGGQVVLERLGTLLRQEVQTATGLQQSEWQGIESSLTCICAIHRFVPSDESEHLPYCFSLIPQLPSGIRPLQVTVSQVIGKFAAWLAVHSTLLHPLMPYLAQGLSDPHCAPAAAVAIKELCECSNQSFAMAEPVLQLYTVICSQSGVRLQLAEELQVLEGACRAISRQIQDTRCDGAAFIGQLTGPIAARLSTAIAEANASPPRLIPDIERLTVAIQYIVTPVIPPNAHPMVEVLKSCWHFFDDANARFPGDNMLAEKICRLHKHALRGCGAHAYAPLFDALVQHIVSSFERSRQSPFLYAASIVITEYGQDALYTQRIYGMVVSLSTTVFLFLRNLEDLTNHPDVAEEFFYMMGRMMNNCPDPIVLSALLQSLVQCAVVGMQLDHQGANKGTLRFLEDLISYGLSLREVVKPNCQEALERVLSQEGQPIVANLAHAITGDHPAYNDRLISEILWKFNLLCPNMLAQWLGAAFHGVDRLPEPAKVAFLGALGTGLARDEFSLAVRAFQSECQRQHRNRRFQHPLGSSAYGG